MGAFNPYSKSPDFGSWGQDTAMNIMQWLVMKQMFGGMGNTGGTGATTQQAPPNFSLGQQTPPSPGAPAFSLAGGQGGPTLGQQNTPGQPPGNIDYAKLMQIMAMLGQRR